MSILRFFSAVKAWVASLGENHHHFKTSKLRRGMKLARTSIKKYLYAKSILTKGHWYVKILVSSNCLTNTASFRDKPISSRSSRKRHSSSRSPRFTPPLTNAFLNVI